MSAPKSTVSLRAVLLGLIVLATAGFIVGTTIERNSGENRGESAASLKAEGKTQATHAEGGGESPAAHAKEVTAPAANTAQTTNSGHHAELKPLGINVE